VRAKILACSLRASKWVEEVVATEESLAVARWGVASGVAVDRMGWEAGGLSMEVTVRASKLTRGQEEGEVREAFLEISQEKEICSMSLWRVSQAEMGL